jgi:hypothetical protein
VTRLVTSVDLEDRGADHSSTSFSARHEALLADGRRVLLLGDRGWSSTGPPDLWAGAPVEEFLPTARTVVGPDEPHGEYSHEDMAAAHWAHLSEVLRQQGVRADPGELQRLPHDVVLGERLRARIGGVAGTPG